MPRARPVLVVVLGPALLILAAFLGGADPAIGAGAVAPTTTLAVASVVPSAVPTTVASPVSTVPRGGAASTNLVKPEDEEWSLRRVLTTTGLTIVALAAIGFVYGRIRSTPPRHPDLARE
jgi:hypothetical protein